MFEIGQPFISIFSVSGFVIYFSYGLRNSSEGANDSLKKKNPIFSVDEESETEGVTP